ncbi:MAG: hypothetical protein JW709_12945 [Sedimentisphaerales bacterium]|nr:hypothetical protein [Sedimentisphaerales bacterium]
MKNLVMLVVASLFILCHGQTVQAVTVVQDTFTQTDARVAGEPLDGTFTEIGNREWYNRATGDHYVFVDPDGFPGTADDTISRVAGSTSIQVALVDYIANPAGETITVSSDLYFPNADTQQDGAIVFYPTGINVGGAASLNLDMCTFTVRIYNRQTDIDGNLCNARLLCWYGATEVNLYTEVQSVYDNVGVASQPLVVAYNTATGILNVTVNGDPVFTNLDVPALITGWTPDIAYAGFFLTEGGANTLDNFKIESDNPLLSPPTTDVVQSVGTSDAALSWITVDGVAWRPTVDGLIPAHHDFDAEWARYQDPNGPVEFEYMVGQGDPSPATIAAASQLTADFDLSTGVNLDYDTKGLDPVSRYHFSAGVSTHAGPDVVILVDRSTDYVCSAVDFDIEALDIADNPFFGQSITVSCGGSGWNTFPGDMGQSDHYQVTDNDPLTFEQKETTTREELVAIALDYEIGLTLGGITVVPQSSKIRVMDVFALPATGGTPWDETSCQAGVFLYGDLDKDCDVDLDDFAILAQGWLGCNDLFDPTCWN